MAIYVKSGVCSTVLRLSDTMYVLSGGTARETGVESSGRLEVSSGGVARDTNVYNFGYMRVSGLASVTTVYDSGDMTVFRGGVASVTYVDGGVCYVNNGGVASYTNISRGSMRISSGGVASMNYVHSRGTLIIDRGGKTFDTVVYNSGSFIIFPLFGPSGPAGAATSTTVKNGGVFRIEGGLANSTTLEFNASMHVSSGGWVSNTTVSRGYLYVSSGGVTSLTTLSGGVMYVRSGAVASKTTVESGGILRVYNGGRATSVAVCSAGSMTVTGMVGWADVQRGGLMYVYAGGTANSTTVGMGDVYVSGGAVSNTALSAGGLYVSSGGRAVSATASSGSVVRVYSGGLLSGGTFSKISYLWISGGGTAVSSLMESGGWATVYSGAVMSSTVIDGGGLSVSRGGVASNTVAVASGGSIKLQAGAKHTGRLSITSTTVVTAEAHSIIDFDLSALAPGNLAPINFLSYITGNPDYTVTVRANQTTGSYRLASGAGSFDKTVTVVTDTGKTLGDLAVGGTLKSGNNTYSLAKSGAALSLTVSDAVRANPADLNGDGRADVVMTITQSTHPHKGATGAWLIQSTQTAVWGDLSQRNDGWTIFGTGFTSAAGSTADVYLKSTGNVVGAWTTDNTGKVTGWETVGEFDANTQVLGLGDFSGNGQTDLLLRNTNGAVGCCYTSDPLPGTVPGWHYFQSLGPEWKICGIGDLNGDGKSDVVLKHDAGFAGSWLTQADLTMAWADLDTLPSGYSIVGCGDFDGDGTDDVLLKKGNYYGAWIVRNGNAKSWMGLGDLGNVTVEEIADFDADGRDDLRIRTAAGDLGAQLVKGADTLAWRYYGSVGSEWSTSLAAI